MNTEKEVSRPNSYDQDRETTRRVHLQSTDEMLAVPTLSNER